MFFRKINRWLWRRFIGSNGYHRLHVWHTPFGIYYLLRWGYRAAGFCQFFSMGKRYLRTRQRLWL